MTTTTTCPPTNRTRRPAGAAATSALAIAAMLALTACASSPADGDARAAAPPGGAADATGPAEHDASLPAGAEPVAGSASARFVACLRADGVEAGISAQGFVKVRFDDPSWDLPEGTSIAMSAAPDAPADMVAASALLVWRDDDGLGWAAPRTAAFFADDAATHDAWLACEAQVPGFEQLGWDDIPDDPETLELIADQHAAALAFARRARDAGFAWVADPGSTPVIALPAWLTEAELRSLLEEALDPDAVGFGWTADGSLGFDWAAVVSEYLGPDSMASFG